MRAKFLMALALALATLATPGAVGEIPLSAGGIEIQGVLTARGRIRLAVQMTPTSAAQPCVQAVRLTTLPSGTPLATFVIPDAPDLVTESAFQNAGAVLQAHMTHAPVTTVAAGPPAGDNRIRVEYVLQAQTGELSTFTVGEAQFSSLESFHFSLETTFDSRMPPTACAFCGDDRCGCTSCAEVYICCPTCVMRCEQGSC